MNARHLLDALALPFEVAHRKVSTMPILGHIKLADGKACATNNFMTVERDMPDASLGCCAPATRLAAALNAITALDKDADVKLSVKGSQLVVAGARARYSMPTMPADAFPMPVWPEEQQPIEGWDEFASALRFAVVPCTRTDIRPFCHGVGTREGYVGGTDGHRGAICVGESKVRDGLVIPLEAVPVMTALKGGKGYGASENNLLIHFDGGRFSTQLVQSGFPDLRRVVAVVHEEPTAIVEREALRAGVSAILKTKMGDYMKLYARKDVLVLEEESAGVGSSRIEVHCTYAGPEWETGINTRFVGDAIEHLDGKNLTISHASGKPILFTGDKPSRAVAIMSANV